MNNALKRLEERKEIIDGVREDATRCRIESEKRGQEEAERQEEAVRNHESLRLEQARLRQDWERAQKGRTINKGESKQTVTEGNPIHKLWGIKQVRKGSIADVDMETEPTTTKQDHEISPSMQKRLAREWTRRKHREALQAVGGPVFEHLLYKEKIDLGWELLLVIKGEACSRCHKKGIVELFGMWRCPDGGAKRCLSCLNELSTYGRV